MSAILSADDLNDFITPGVACIKPVETLPLQKPALENPYEVTTEGEVAGEPQAAQISLTDCLACSGCVTSAEAILVSLQSHSEVLKALDSRPALSPPRLRVSSDDNFVDDNGESCNGGQVDGMVFVASVSPQVRASVAATYGTTEKEAGWMIEQLLSGPEGLKVGGRYGNSFAWVVDTNAMREAMLVMGAEEVAGPLPVPKTSPCNTDGGLKKPILSSACPGWICYAEKTHPHVLPHLSRLKSPQALTGTMFKSVLSKALRVDPGQIWHLAIMPCFDKKLEASRKELTDASWINPAASPTDLAAPVRDVDCVITAREILMLAETRGISFPSLPRLQLDPSTRIPFPDAKLDSFLFPRMRSQRKQIAAAGSSGGYLYHMLCTYQSSHPGSVIRSERGRNADVVDYSVVRNDEVLFRAARYYGFRNIQNLVRKLKPPKKSRLPGGKIGVARKPNAARTSEPDYAYVEVMACPGGCTNGGGQIKVDDLGDLQSLKQGIESQKEWLARVDEAYYSMDGDGDGADAVDGENQDLVNGVSTGLVQEVLSHWSKLTDVELSKLIYTSYRAVESDVGKVKGGDTERVAELAGKIGGGW